MRTKSFFVWGGVALGAVVASVGGVALMGGGGGERAAVRAEVTRTARAQQDPGAITEALEKRGATSCTGDRTRVECRYQDRYVAATVVTDSFALSMDTALQTWKTGVGQSLLGDQGAFAILRGPNWLVTGPDRLVEGVRPALGGKILHCDRPYGTCA